MLLEFAEPGANHAAFGRKFDRPITAIYNQLNKIRESIMSNAIAIIGAGLTGLMCSLQLATRGFLITVYERRSHSDIILENYTVNRGIGRSMSMDLSARGMFAIKNLGLLNEVESKSIRMTKKVFHNQQHQLIALDYSPQDNEYILSIGRSALYRILLEKCKHLPNITIKFHHELKHIDFFNRSLLLSTNNGAIIAISPQLIIGADGVNSSVRYFLETSQGKQFTTKRFPLSYKELAIPSPNAVGLFMHATHIWPRNGMMLLAQPNADLSFTCALLMREAGHPTSFEEISSPTQIRQLFDSEFADISKRMPSLENDYQKSPVGRLRAILGTSWTAQDFVLLLGDAAHGMVPFFGQGVNCCFEDCTFVADCLDQSNNDWRFVFAQIDSIRVAEANAINELSYQNYPELFSNCDLKHAQLIKQIEDKLSQSFPESYRSYHNLVCFDRIPYSLAQKIKTIQVSLLERLSQNVERADQLDAISLGHAISSYLAALAKIDQ